MMMMSKPLTNQSNRSIEYVLKQQLWFSSEVFYQLAVHVQIDTEAEGEEQLILLKQGATHVDIQRVGKVVSQDVKSAEDTQHFINLAPKQRELINVSGLTLLLLTVHKRRESSQLLFNNILFIYLF